MAVVTLEEMKNYLRVDFDDDDALLLLLFFPDLQLLWLLVTELADIMT